MVPGSADTIEAGRWARMFNSEDFPAFGEPRRMVCIPVWRRDPLSDEVK